jgi:hypothetical protein
VQGEHGGLGVLLVRAALDQLLERLVDVPTPGGLTPGKCLIIVELSNLMRDWFVETTQVGWRRLEAPEVPRPAIGAAVGWARSPVPGRSEH